MCSLFHSYSSFVNFTHSTWLTSHVCNISKDSSEKFKSDELTWQSEATQSINLFSLSSFSDQKHSA